MRTRALMLMTAGILSAWSAEAQSLEQPRLELGGTVSVFAPLPLGVGPLFLLGAGPRATMNIGRGMGVELLVDRIAPAEDSVSRGLYAGQLKFPVSPARGSGASLFITLGAVGSFGYNSYQERRITRPDGSVVVHPGARTVVVTAPALLSVGFERRQAFSRRWSHSLAVQGYVGPGGLTVRSAFGLSFGVGTSR